MEIHHIAIFLMIGALVSAGCCGLSEKPCLPFDMSDYSTPLPNGFGSGEIHAKGACMDGAANSSERYTTIDMTTEGMKEAYINASSSIYPIYDDSILRYYNFDIESSQGDALDPTFDASPQAYPANLIGQAKGVKLGSGYGGALKFNGIDSEAYAGSPEYYSSGEFSAEIWVRPLSKKNQMLAISGGGWQRDGFYMNIYDGRYYFTIPNKRGGWQAYTDPGIEPGKWVHMAVSAKKGDEMMIYLNGERMDAYTSVPTDFITPSSGLTIGFSPGQALFGYVDSFILYNRSLSDDEIRWHYRTTLMKDGENRWSMAGSQRWQMSVYDPALYRNQE